MSHHGCKTHHRSMKTYNACGKKHMHGEGFSDIVEGVKNVYNKAKGVYDHLREHKYANRIRNTPILG